VRYLLVLSLFLPINSGPGWSLARAVNTGPLFLRLESIPASARPSQPLFLPLSVGPTWATTRRARHPAPPHLARAIPRPARDRAILAARSWLVLVRAWRPAEHCGTPQMTSRNRTAFSRGTDTRYGPPIVYGAKELAARCGACWASDAGDPPASRGGPAAAECRVGTTTRSDSDRCEAFLHFCDPIVPSRRWRSAGSRLRVRGYPCHGASRRVTARAAEHRPCHAPPRAAARAQS
jgi:hypothetical protein